MKLANIFDSIANQMRSDFEKARNALQHPGLKGDAFENAFREVLRKYLPRKLDVLQGVAVDALGNTSKQLDVIISDALNTPFFYESQDIRVVPAEMIYAAIEIKANLDISELQKCLDNMNAVRSLKRCAYQPGTSMPVKLYGREFPFWPTNYYVLAIDSAPLESLSKYLCEYYVKSTAPPEQRIDTICVLNRGVIMNQDPLGNFDALPAPGFKIAYLNTSRALLLFYALTARYWFQTALPPLDIRPYLQTMKFGKNET